MNLKHRISSPVLALMVKSERKLYFPQITPFSNKLGTLSKRFLFKQCWLDILDNSLTNEIKRSVSKMLTAIQGISMSHRDEAADNSDDDMQDVGVADANY